MHNLRNKKKEKAQQGFSLVELIIVLAMLGILTAIAIPSFSRWVPNFKLKGTARDLYSHMQKARLKAIKDNTNIAVSFTTVVYPVEGGGYTVFADNGSGGGVRGNGIQDGAENTLWAIPMGKNISMVNAAFGAAPSFSYTPNGVVAQSRSGNAIVRNSQRWYRVTVSASGGLRLELSSDGVTWN